MAELKKNYYVLHEMSTNLMDCRSDPRIFYRQKVVQHQLQTLKMNKDLFEIHSPFISLHGKGKDYLSSIRLLDKSNKDDQRIWDIHLKEIHLEFNASLSQPKKIETNETEGGSGSETGSNEGSQAQFMELGRPKDEKMEENFVIDVYREVSLILRNITVESDSNKFFVEVWQHVRINWRFRWISLAHFTGNSRIDKMVNLTFLVLNEKGVKVKGYLGAGKLRIRLQSEVAYLDKVLNFEIGFDPNLSPLDDLRALVLNNSIADGRNYGRAKFAAWNVRNIKLEHKLNFPFFDDFQEQSKRVTKFKRQTSSI